MTKRRFVHICISLLAFATLSAQDTVFVSGAIQHDGILEWPPVRYGSNSYLDLGVHWQTERGSFRELRANTRLELTQWPLPGYETDFGGHGVSHLSVAAAFNRGEITVGDVYGQFGSGLILNLYEDRAVGIDGALRGAKIEVTPYKGIHLTALGGKQRRYWNCYHDAAWGWNYSRDAAMGADLELNIDQWSPRMQEKEMGLMIGGSYVSKYEAFDTIITQQAGGTYMYNLPRWVGAGDVRTLFRVKGFNMLLEYALKANDPCAENQYDYAWGQAFLASMSYSRKGLSALLQVKWSENMSFRSERQRTGIAGRLNHMPAFAQQHTYALAALYPYATQYSGKELAMQGEVRYTWAKKSRRGGKYGTTMKLSFSHIRGQQNWEEVYTDINVELNKRISKNWWLNAMLMYQAYNQLAIEGHGGMIRSGIAVADARVQINNNVSMRGELQYMYSPHHEGQWVFALYELSLYKHLTLSGQWMYNIGHAPQAKNEHFYAFSATYTHGAHRLELGYTKTKDGYNCAGGVCRYVPREEGMTVSYHFNW